MLKIQSKIIENLDVILEVATRTKQELTDYFESTDYEKKQLLKDKLQNEMENYFSGLIQTRCNAVKDNYEFYIDNKHYFVDDEQADYEREV